jgi:hypothetical protein
MKISEILILLTDARLDPLKQDREVHLYTDDGEVFVSQVYFDKHICIDLTDDERFQLRGADDIGIRW